jgi:hypothetical protein
MTKLNRVRSGRRFEVGLARRRVLVSVCSKHGVQNVNAPAGEAKQGLCMTLALLSFTVVVDP